jgi:enoyl-[acyl-carrier protein] reductase/trans-2-enoyl-CoA reductase (NAD+)
LKSPVRRVSTGSAGWYNSVAFETAARREGLYATSLNGDAFSDTMKEQVIARIKADLGQVDAVIYSLASPPTASIQKPAVLAKSCSSRSVHPFTAKSVETDKGSRDRVSIEPANEQEIAETISVMGGEDWEMWIDALAAEGLLAQAP